MNLIEGEDAIYSNIGYGPIFGANFDIYILDRCHKTNANYTYFPTCYNNGKYKKGQPAYTMFCGSKDGRCFYVREY